MKRPAPPNATRRRGILLAGLALLALGACEGMSDLLAGVDKPTARIVGAALRGLDLEGVDLAFDVEVQNPYDVPLPLARIDGTLASRGAAFLSTRSDLQGTVPANGRQVVPVAAKVRFAEALQALSGVRPGAVVPYEAELGLSVDVPGTGPLRLPVRTEGELPIPAVPEVALSGVRFEALSLTEASAVLSLSIGNTNAFPIDLARLGYQLDLGGIPVVSAAIDRSLAFAPGGRQALEIPVTFRPMDLGAAAFSMLSGREASYRLAGAIEASTRFGPLHLPYAAAGRTTFSR